MLIRYPRTGHPRRNCASGTLEGLSEKHPIISIHVPSSGFNIAELPVHGDVLVHLLIGVQFDGRQSMPSSLLFHKRDEVSPVSSTLVGRSNGHILKMKMVSSRIEDHESSHHSTLANYENLALTHLVGIVRLHRSRGPSNSLRVGSIGVQCTGPDLCNVRVGRLADIHRPFNIQCILTFN